MKHVAVSFPSVEQSLLILSSLCIDCEIICQLKRTASRPIQARYTIAKDFRIQESNEIADEYDVKMWRFRAPFASPDSKKERQPIAFRPTDRSLRIMI